MTILNALEAYPDGARTIYVYGVDPHRTCLNQRIHWRRRHERTRAAMSLARNAWARAGSPTASAPIRYRLRVYRGRMIDEGAVVEGCKPIVDALFRKAITPDDSPKWCALDGIEQFTGKKHQFVNDRSPVVAVIWWEVKPKETENVAS